MTQYDIVSYDMKKKLGCCIISYDTIKYCNIKYFVMYYAIQNDIVI